LPLQVVFPRIFGVPWWYSLGSGSLSDQFRPCPRVRLAQSLQRNSTYPPGSGTQSAWTRCGRSLVCSCRSPPREENPGGKRSGRKCPQKNYNLTGPLKLSKPRPVWAARTQAQAQKPLPRVRLPAPRRNRSRINRTSKRSQISPANLPNQKLPQPLRPLNQGLR